MVIRTPDQHLRVFVSSTLKELAEERKAARQAILNLHLAPVMFESGARPHPAQELYKSYLSQSQIFIGIYWQSYGWVAPNVSISGLEDEYNLSAQMPRLIYIKNPAPNREPALVNLLDRIRDDNTSCYTFFSTPQELAELIQNDLALMLTEHFEAGASKEQQQTDTPHHPPTNVPVSRTPLIGREQELSSLKQLLLQEDVAMITLTGVGGAGKSRLALQVGVEILDHFKDGVYLVRLESVSNPELVISTLADTLGIRETTSSRPVAEMLREFLRDKQMLLILDNLEQVIAAAPDVATLLEACPGLKTIVTSRVPLRLRLEKEFPVPPLAFPSLETLIGLDHLSQYTAVELFIQRAQAVKPDFVVTNTNAPAVAEICYRLDGLPLAIELAAARIKLLTPHELLARLVHSFDVLHTETRDLPERQRTLRGTIDWSYNLLTEAEQKLFRRLSIFVDGWTLDAAESICDLEGDLTQSLDDLLSTLIDDNLVNPGREIDEQSRFGMLTTLHDYAYERLVQSGEVDSIRLQHAQYYLDFVKTVEPRVRSADHVRWHQVLLKEFGNIRSVLDWISMTGNCIEIGQQMVITLGLFWVTTGYIAECRKWCAQIMPISGESTPIAIRAALLCVASMTAFAQGDYISAGKSADESLELFRSMNIKTRDEIRLSAMSLLSRGMLASASRDLATAATMYQRSRELLDEINDQWLGAIVISMLGDIAWYENDSERAQTLYKESIKLARQQGDPWCLMPSLMTSGQVAMVKGDLANARSFFFEAEELLRKTGDQWSLSWALNDVGHVALMDGEFDLAAVVFLEGLTLANTLGNRNVLLLLLTGIAALIVRRESDTTGDQKQNGSTAAKAALLSGAASSHIDQPGVFVWANSKMLYDSDITQVQALVDKEVWNKFFIEGQSMLIDQAVNLAIQLLKK